MANGHKSFYIDLRGELEAISLARVYNTSIRGGQKRRKRGRRGFVRWPDLQPRRMRIFERGDGR